MPATSRGFRYPPETGAGADPDVPRDIGNLAADINAMWASATGAAFAGMSPGIVGREIFINTTGGGYIAGEIFLDIGTGFVRKTAPPNTFQPLDAELSAIASLVSAADQLPYFTGSGTAALAALSGFARTLIDDANAAVARATLDVRRADKVVQTVTSASSVTFASLDGDNDIAYRVVLAGRLAQGGVARYVTLRPNNDTTSGDYTSKMGVYGTTGTGPQNAPPDGGTGLPLASSSFSGQAVTTDHSLASEIVFNAQSGHDHLANTRDSNVTRYWYGTSVWTGTTNITSLVVDMGGGTFTGSVILEKLGVA